MAWIACPKYGCIFDLKGIAAMVQYRELNIDEITLDLFNSFQRKQIVTDCWRKENGKWTIKSAPFIDDWNADDYKELVRCLRNTILTGGFVYGAFINNELKGFTSVEGMLMGSSLQYADLSSIHVSQDTRGQGIGRNLFSAAKAFAVRINAKKLYISSHSAVESQAFYRAMGCTEAEEYILEHVEKEPYDCQLECILPQPALCNAGKSGTAGNTLHSRKIL